MKTINTELLECLIEAQKIITSIYAAQFCMPGDNKEKAKKFWENSPKGRKFKKTIKKATK